MNESTMKVIQPEHFRKPRGYAHGAVWRERFGKHYPAMALVGVTELVHPQAKVEIEAVASLPPE